ncbi:unnamed protein product [Gongylonema pulchrum]|uniref:5'-nucleotidase n=1 Tax=Gongylonema pulchrum TaxID=637853 RepID=A0A3P7N4S4_9BILA|nr:unnamed protein product [Gongylonema pulchrum]
MNMNLLKNHPKVRIGNLGLFEQKMKQFMGSGPDNFMVVADFDYTLTASVTDTGQPCDITYGAFVRAAIKKSPHYRQLFRDLNDKFAPIEANFSLGDKERSAAMQDWFVRIDFLEQYDTGIQLHHPGHPF